MTQHTPTPWRKDFLLIHPHDSEEIIADVRVNLGDNTKLADANAAHIVKCVNLHDELVAFVREYRDESEASGGWENDDALFNGAVAILAKAEQP